MRILDVLWPYVAKSALVEKEEQLIQVSNEYKNYRRRTQSEIKDISIKVKSDTVNAFLTVYDNLQRALIQGCTDEAFFKGVQMTMNELESVLKSLGVIEIEALGQPFDPIFHHAVEHVEKKSDSKENIVIEVLQKGFILENQVIRFAKVKVTN